MREGLLALLAAPALPRPAARRPISCAASGACIPGGKAVSSVAARVLNPPACLQFVPAGEEAFGDIVAPSHFALDRKSSDMTAAVPFPACDFMIGGAGMLAGESQSGSKTHGIVRGMALPPHVSATHENTAVIFQMCGRVGRRVWTSDK